MNVEKIEDLEAVLEEILGQNLKIVGQKLSRLTAPGDNYGSTMLSLEITLQNQTNNEKQVLYTVAKLIPPTPFLQEMFKIQVTFKNEINFYKSIIPTLQNFQKQKGVKNVINFFPKFYGARTNLGTNFSEVDQNGVIILENLKVSGFETCERLEGFDLATAQLVIKDLATLHSVPIALKLEQPNLFHEKIREYLTDFVMEEEIVCQNCITLFGLLEKCRPYLDRAKAAMFPSNNLKKREPFATVIHNDYWTNNTMIKFDQNSTPIQNKMVDFQICEYNSFAKDLIFFLFTSVKTSVLKTDLDNLINLYYHYFIKNLEELRCDTTHFSRKAFDEEMKIEARESQFMHINVMLFPIYQDKRMVKELDQLSIEDDLNFDFKKLTKGHKEKATYTLLEFVKRGWL